MLTAKRLRELLFYDPSTGKFKNLVRRSHSLAGRAAGSRHNMGYLKINLDGKQYLMHRLAWLYVHGRWPLDEIDHINGVRDDNRISNLREASRTENNRNQKTSYSNKVGLKGVFKHRKKYHAQIKIKGVSTHLGCFNTPEEAHAAYCAAARNIHGNFASWRK